MVVSARAGSGHAAETGGEPLRRRSQAGPAPGMTRTIQNGRRSEGSGGGGSLARVLLDSARDSDLPGSPLSSAVPRSSRTGDGSRCRTRSSADRGSLVRLKHLAPCRESPRTAPCRRSRKESHHRGMGPPSGFTRGHSGPKFCRPGACASSRPAPLPPNRSSPLLVLSCPDTGRGATIFPAAGRGSWSAAKLGMRPDGPSEVEAVVSGRACRPAGARRLRETQERGHSRSCHRIDEAHPPHGFHRGGA